MRKVAVIKKSNVDDRADLVRLSDGLKRSPHLAVTFCDRLEDIPSDSERVLVFGGDGTVLAAAPIIKSVATRNRCSTCTGCMVLLSSR